LGHLQIPYFIFSIKGIVWRTSLDSIVNKIRSDPAHWCCD